MYTHMCMCCFFSDTEQSVSTPHLESILTRPDLSGLEALTIRVSAHYTPHETSSHIAFKSHSVANTCICMPWGNRSSTLITVYFYRIVLSTSTSSDAAKRQMAFTQNLGTISLLEICSSYLLSFYEIFIFACVSLDTVLMKSTVRSRPIELLKLEM